MSLPPGTLRALKGQYDNIVVVVLAAMAFTALAIGSSAWPTVGILALSYGAFHIRRRAAERHQSGMAQHRVTEAAVRVEATKARYRALYSDGEPELDLKRPLRRLTGSNSSDDGAER
jgi:hypothetical protein